MHVLGRYTQIITVALLAISIHLPSMIVKEYLESKRKSIRKEVKTMINAGLREDQLVRLAFSKQKVNTQVRWVKDHEFEYLDEMYDIVRHSASSDSVVYWCWKDNDENWIKQQLNAVSAWQFHQEKSNDPQQKRQAEYTKNLICPSVIRMDTAQNIIPTDENSLETYVHLILMKTEITIDAPPPECA